ncbi:MAG: D-alanyl-D-alanine carboxypeptidase family protein, partial [Acidimicrobiia bacterium]
AVAIAEHVAGSVSGFVDMMNGRGAEMGLESTNFKNPHGLDAPGHHSSARDLLRIALAGMEWPAFATAVATPEYSLPDAPDGAVRVAKTTNALLRDGFDGILGIKTGFTNDAGLTFVAAAERDRRTLYAVVLGSEGPSAHFNDAGALLEWGFSEFRLVELFVEGTTYGQYRGSEGTEPLVAENSSQVLLTRTARRTDVSFEPRFEEETPVMVATLEDTELARVPLSLGSPREMPSLADALAWMGHYWNWLWNG